MSEIVEEKVRDVLQAMRTKLRFSTTILARLDADRGGLVLSSLFTERFSILEEATELLGFDLTGAIYPLWAEESLFIRCYREGRLLSTTDIRDLWKSVLPFDAFDPITSAVGPRLYVAVPLPATTGSILGVVVLDRPLSETFEAEERDQLLLYAARLGRLLEEDRLGVPPVDSGAESPFSRWLSVHLLDRSLASVWSAGAGPAARAVVAALEGKLKPGKVEVTLADGAAVLINAYMVDPKGKVVWLLLCENLARRDREVRELREQLRLRLARIQETVVSVDREGRVTGCNDAARDVLGYEPAEMIGLPVTALVPGDVTRPAHRRFVATLLEQGHVERQFELRRKDGSRFPAEVSVLLLADESDEPTGAIATVRDLSEQQRQAEERGRLRRQLLRSERLAALGEMAARIAHEVRNPLAAIGAAALSIEEDEAAGDTSQQQGKAIGAEVRRLDVILTDLLQFAKPSPVTRRHVDLSGLVVDAIESAKAEPQAKEIDFVVDVEVDGHLRVSGDANGLRQVLMNVLRNAIEACAPHGRIVCDVRRTKKGVHVQITDDGSGLSRAAERRAFEPFYSTKSRGTGLGLPISQRIIQEHGGTIEIGTNEEGGTIVSFTLAVSEEPNGRA